jgi:hypothetical protein
MKIGRIKSLTNGPKRDIELRICPHEVFCAISEPQGVIQVSDISGYEIEEEKKGPTYTYPDYLFRFFIQLQTGARILFYTGSTRFDMALLLDEMIAIRKDIPIIKIPEIQK